MIEWLMERLNIEDSGTARDIFSFFFLLLLLNVFYQFKS